jgi:hypothetical protein
MPREMMTGTKYLESSIMIFRAEEAAHLCVVIASSTLSLFGIIAENGGEYYVAVYLRPPSSARPVS